MIHYIDEEKIVLKILYNNEEAFQVISKESGYVWAKPYTLTTYWQSNHIKSVKVAPCLYNLYSFDNIKYNYEPMNGKNWLRFLYYYSAGTNSVPWNYDTKLPIFYGEEYLVFYQRETDGPFIHISNALSEQYRPQTPDISSVRGNVEMNIPDGNITYSYSLQQPQVTVSGNNVTIKNNTGYSCSVYYDIQSVYHGDEGVEELIFVGGNAAGGTSLANGRTETIYIPDILIENFKANRIRVMLVTSDGYSASPMVTVDF